MALREVFARFGVEVEGQDKVRRLDADTTKAAKGLESTGKQAEKTGQSFTALASGIAAAFAGNQLLGAIKNFAGELDVLDDLNAQTGIATDQLQVLGYAAELNGSSAAEMNNALTLLQKGMGKTAEAAGPQVEALAKLKIATTDAAGAPRQLNEVLPEILANFSGLKNEADQAAVATSLFGRAGVRLIPTLKQGEKGMAALRAELDANGGLVAADTIAKAGEFRDNIARMDRALFALKGNLAAAVFPQLSKVVTVLASGVGKLSEWVKSTTLAESATIALAGAVGGTLFKALAPYLKGGLKFAAIFLAFDDLVAFLQGKDSLIGRLLNAAFGDGTADQVRAWVLDAKNAFSDFVGSANATADALTSSNASWTERSLAILVGFFRDAAAGFPAFRAGFTSTLDGMYADILGFVARGLEAWNSFVSAIKIPPAIVAALSIIPGAAPAAAALNSAAPAATVDTSSIRATEAAARELAAQNAATAAASLRGYKPGTTPGTAQEFLAANPAGAAPRTARVDFAAESAAKAQGDAQAQIGSLAALRSSGVVQGATLNDNKSISISFQAGTSKEDQAAIRSIVGEAIKSDNRVALQQLTARGTKR